MKNMPIRSRFDRNRISWLRLTHDHAPTRPQDLTHCLPPLGFSPTGRGTRHAAPPPACPSRAPHRRGPSISRGARLTLLTLPFVQFPQFPIFLTPSHRASFSCTGGGPGVRSEGGALDPVSLRLGQTEHLRALTLLSQYFRYVTVGASFTPPQEGISDFISGRPKPVPHSLPSPPPPIPPAPIRPVSRGGRGPHPGCILEATEGHPPLLCVMPRASI